MPDIEKQIAKSKKRARRAWKRARKNARSTWKDARGGASDLWSDARHGAEDLWSSARHGAQDTWHDARGRAHGAWSGARSGAEHAWSDARSGARDAWSSTRAGTQRAADRASHAVRFAGDRTVDGVRSARERSAHGLRSAGERSAHGLHSAGERAAHGLRSAGERTAHGLRSAGERSAHAVRHAGHVAAARARGTWERRPRVPAGRLLLAAGAAVAVAMALRAWRDSRLESWAGRVVLVTGGTRGLGLLVARELAADGCKIVICGRNESELRRAEKDLEARGANVLAIRCDVSDADEVAEMVSRAIQRFGRVDVLVNNAGDIEVGPVEHATIEDFRRPHQTIFEGAVHCTLAVLPEMLKRGSGHIVNVSSIGGRIAVPHLIPYDSAKFALTGFSEGLRAELDQRGIVVTTVFPGTMRTGSYRGARFKGQHEREYAWFSAGSTLPVVSMSAERAARAIVLGAKRGDAEVVVPLYAKLLTRLHGIAPRMTGALAALVARALPEPGVENGEAREGRRIERDMPPGKRRWLRGWTILGRLGGKRALQPHEDEPPRAGDLARPNVSDAERALNCAAGAMLVLGGARRGGGAGLLASALGAALVARGATGRCPAYRALGRNARPAGARRAAETAVQGERVR